MNIFEQSGALKKFISDQKLSGKTIGFVPTMGALHQGHLSLIKTAKSENTIVVASIFVNPTQFDNKEDLAKYPKTLSNDIELLQSIQCDALFAPSVEEIYHENVQHKTFDFDGLDQEMEGAFRQNHFNGVATIVTKLFEIVEPNKAYFGEKDFQQLQIIKKTVEKLHIPVTIVGGEIYRESDGLAMSSRNVRLTKTQRKAAPFIYKTLHEANLHFASKTIDEIVLFVQNQFKNNKTLKLEYFVIADENSLKSTKIKEKNKEYRAFIAVYAGKIRLIDNMKLTSN